MRIKTTLLLLVAVLLAGGALWYLEGRKEWDELRRREAARMLRVHPERVQRVVFDTGDRLIDCRIVDGIWRVIHPVDARADAGEMDRILTALSRVEKSEVISPRDRRELGLSLQDFGLERPRARIEWEDDLGRRALLIGRNAPVGEMVYVMKEGAEDIFSVSSRLLTIMPESALALRDRILFHGDPRRAYRLEIRRAGGFLQVVKSEDGTWRLQQPIAARADRGAVRQLIDRIFEWRIEDFVADAISDATVYGLDDAATQVTVYTEGKESGQTVLLGSARDQQNGFVYARRRDGQSVFSVPGHTLDEARVRPNDLRDRALLTMKPQDVGSIEIQRGEHALRLSRDTNAQWKIRRPKQWNADAARVHALLDAWTGARIAVFVEETGTNLAALGFTEDSFQITFRLPSPRAVGPEDGEPTAESVTVWVSDAPVTEGQLLVKKMNESFLYEIPATVQDVTTWNPLYYRHREVIRLDEAAVRRVRQTRDGIEQVVARDSAGAFVPAPGMDGVIDDTVLSKVLSILTALQVDEYLVDDPADWAPYGLDEPRVVWSLDLTGEAGIRRVLMLGNMRADGRVHGRTRGQDVVFLLDQEDSAQLMRDLFEAQETPVMSIPELDLEPAEE